VKISRLFLGYDPREDEAYQVAKFSALRHTGPRLQVTALRREPLQRAGIYTRPEYAEDGQRYDDLDGRPFSTEFAFSRFLVPALCQYDTNWAIFADCDFLFTRSLEELDQYADDRFAVLVVKHLHLPSDVQKMDGQAQTRYHRKNWSSFIMFNCSHPANRRLTLPVVNGQTGAFLHAFGWLEDDLIGELPMEWNYLVGWNKPMFETPAALHFTSGGPWFEGYKDVPYANLWLHERGLMLGYTDD
jgi:hypothetical protein